MSQSTEQLVANSALMRAANEGALKLLHGARLLPRSFAAGEYVFRTGDTADVLYLLFGARPQGDGLAVDPLLQVEMRTQSSKLALRFERVVEGEIFGELEWLREGMTAKQIKRTTSAFALTPATVVPLPITLLFNLFEQDPLIRARVVRIGSQRLLASLQQQHEQLRAHPDLLLADWLIELSVDIGIIEGNRVRFPRKIPQSDIAADLGVTRETISRRLNEWERSGLLRTGARSQQIEILDYQRISRLASLRSSRSREALQRTIDDIDASIAAGDLIRARNIGLDILRYYPSSPELHHRIALAAARSGDFRGAVELLGRSGFPLDEGPATLEETVKRARKNPFLSMERIANDPWVEDGYGEDEFELTNSRNWETHETIKESELVEDLAALHARLLKEQAFGGTTESGRRKQARASFEAYHALYERARGYYPGINAATMALFAGDRSSAREIAERLIQSLQRNAEAYWPLATLAEALLICGRREEARSVLTRARVAKGANDGAKASTILQFRRLAHVLGEDAEALVSEIGPHSVAVISGHMFRGQEMNEAQQVETETAIRARAAKLFKEHNIGFIYGALACGSDVILAETAIGQGCEFNAVLPFNIERFVDLSVRDGDPPGVPGKWEKRLRAVLDQREGAKSLTIIDPADPMERDLDGYFFYAFRYAAGCALQRAAMLQTICRLIVVSDQVQPDGVAGTNRVLRDWRDHGRPFDLIPFPPARLRRAARERAATAFRPVIFFWEVAPVTTAEDRPFEGSLASLGNGFHRIDRTHRDGRRGFCLIAGSTEEALSLGLAAIAEARKEKIAVRIICDFGLVLGNDLKPDKKLVARLQSAGDLPGSPLGCVLATEGYATQAKFDLGDGVSLTPVGRAETYSAEDDSEHRAIRNRPSLPIYTAQRATKHARDVAFMRDHVEIKAC